MASDIKMVEPQTAVERVEFAPKGEEHPVHDPENEEQFTWQSILAVVSIICVYQGYLFSLVMPSAILAYINADLGPSPIYTWISVSWNLAAAVMVSVGGRLSDIFGRRYFYTAAPAISCVGAIVGATSHSIGQSIASGVIFGVGGGLGEMSLGIVQEIVPNRLRVQILGICDTCTTISAFGPLMAYAFIAHTSAGWRAVYWFIFAIELAAFIMVAVFYKPPSFKTKHMHEAKSKVDLLMHLDYLGLFLFTAGLTILLIGITWGGGAHPWKSSYTITPIVVGVALLAGLGVWSRFNRLDYPLIPRRLFHDMRRFPVSCAFIAIANSLYYALGVIWPRQSALLYVPPDNIILRGIWANIPNCGTILGGWWSALVVPRLGSEKWQLVGYITVQTAVVGAMASAGRDKVEAIILVVITLWVNIPMSVLNFAMVSLGLQNQVDVGVSSGLLSTSRLAGGAIATAIYSSIQTSRFAEVLDHNVLSAAASHGFHGNQTTLVIAAHNNTAAAYKLVPGMTSAIQNATMAAVDDSYIESFKLVYLVGIAFGAVAIGLALISKPIDKAKKTRERAVTLENEPVKQKVAV
ncbi:hypothetical protein CLAIMM_14571 [Cladophialophora immunda]|nr:hypothetical protein CLAIMM_14571 [Cladophialophora immunda]